MHKKFSLLVVLTGLLFILALSSQNGRAETMGTAVPLTTLRLTDRDNTFYWANDPVVLAGNYGAHVIWSEHIGSFNDSDLFYAQLPAGTVTRLTDRTATTGLVGLNNNPIYKAVLDVFDNLYVVWSEDVGGNERQDVFFWKTGMAAPVNISDHDLSNGDVGNLFLVLDSNNNAHALWAEAVNVGIFQPNIFYWSEATGVTQKVSLGTGVSGGEFNVTQALALEVHGNTVHALWQDMDENGSGDAEPFYWNSSTGIAKPIRQPGLPGDEQFLPRFFFDGNGVFHVIWQEGDLTDYYYWNSVSEVNLPISGNLALAKFYADGNGNGHFYYTDGDVYHFDTVNQTPALIPDLPATGNVLAVRNGRIGDHFHMLWQNADSNFPSHLNDLFYWRSDMMDPINITDHTLAGADPTNIRMVVDEMDTVHILWEESTNLYYNSSANTTSQLPASLDGQPGGSVIAKNGVAYAVFGAMTSPPFYIWQSDDNSVTPANAALSEMVSGGTTVGGEEATSQNIWFDSNDQLHLLTGTPWHWDAARGVQDLTLGDEMEPVDTNGSLSVAFDASGGSYIVWQGETPVDDGVDMYAAFVSPELPDSIFLPIVLKP
jgi:hypothetical protein